MATVSLEGLDEQAIRDLAATAKSLLDNPRTRIQALALTKAANPDVSIPEVDIPMQVDGMLKKGLERLEAVEKKASEIEMKNTILAQRQEIMKKHGLSEGEVQEIEKMMLEKHIASHDTAAEFYKSQKQSAKPTPSSGYQVNTVPKIDTKNFNGSLAQWSRATAAETIDQIRAGRIAV